MANHNKMDCLTLACWYVALMTTLFLALLAPANAADFQTGLKAYERGDFAAALREWRSLAEQGNADAQYNLGLMYEGGRGVPQDDVQAYAWYNIASAQGNASAATNRDRVAEWMTDEARNRAQRLSHEYWEKYVLPLRD